MKWALEAGRVDERSPLPHEYREVALMRMFGWTYEELQEAPGHLCDWAMAIADVEAQVNRERHERATRG